MIGGRGESKDESPNDAYLYQPRNERVIPSPEHLKAILDEDILTTRVKREEEPTPTSIPTPTQNPEKNLPVIKGPATYYGVHDGYGLDNTLGCTGEPFDPYDEETAARPLNSPFECGDKVKVCDANSCIDVYIKDACPGCDAWGIVIDLSYGAMQKLSPGAGRADVTLEEIR